jgi:hypothetical protein
MTPSSPLDTLKHTALRVKDLLGYVVEQLIVDHDLDENDPLIGSLDAARRLLLEGLAEHIPGVTHDREVGVMRTTREAARRLWRYDDGSPVAVSIEEDGLLWTIFPRLDPDLLDPVRRAELAPPRRPLLALVPALEDGEDIEGEDG